jgi:hypothetical protein
MLSVAHKLYGVPCVHSLSTSFFNAHDGGNLPIGAPPLLYSSKNWLCRVCSLSVFVVLLLVSAALWSVSTSDTRPAKHCYLAHFAAILFTTS